MSDDTGRQVDAWIRAAAAHGEPSRSSPVQAAKRDAGQALAELQALPDDSPERPAAEAKLDAAVDQWRAAKAEEEEAQRVSFDGGARGSPTDAPPSMDSLVLAARDQRREDVVERADIYDRSRRD